MSFWSFVPNFIDDAVDALTGWISHDRQKDTSKDLMNWQNTNEVKMWQMNNEYNSPLNQMKRLQDAGINPNLAFSNGQLSNVTAGSPKSASANPVQAPNFGNSSIAQALMQANELKNGASNRKLQNHQAQLLEMQVLETEAKRMKVLQETIGIQLQNDVNKQNKQWLVEQQRLLNDKIAAEVGLLTDQKLTEQAKRALTTSQIELNEAQKTKLAKDLEVMQSEIAKNYNAIQVGHSVISLNYQNVAESKTRQEESRKRQGVLTEQQYELKLSNILKQNGLSDNSPLYIKAMAMMRQNPKAVDAFVQALIAGETSQDKLDNFVDKNIDRGVKVIDSVLPL